MEFLRRRQRWFRERMWQARCRRVAAAKKLGAKQRKRELELRTEMDEWKAHLNNLERLDDRRDFVRLTGMSIKQREAFLRSTKGTPYDIMVALLRRIAGIHPARQKRDFVLKDMVESLSGKSGPYQCSPDGFDDAIKAIEEG